MEEKKRVEAAQNSRKALFKVDCPHLHLTRNGNCVSTKVYRDNHECHIEVLGDFTLEVQKWHVETHYQCKYDHLSILGQDGGELGRVCHQGPDGWEVKKGDKLLWKTDFSVSEDHGYKGWEICASTESVCECNGEKNIGGGADCSYNWCFVTPGTCADEESSKYGPDLHSSEDACNGGFMCNPHYDAVIKSGFDDHHHFNSHKRGLTTKQCQALCKISKGCTGWKYKRSTTECWLTTRTGNLSLYYAPGYTAAQNC
jgi:hypothetical protein